MTKERAKRKAQQYILWAEQAQKQYDDLAEDIAIFSSRHDFTEPIKLGHHSQRRHERLFEKRDIKMRKLIDLSNKIKRHNEKAENLLAFAERNKGDAEAARNEIRNRNDSFINIGTKIYDPAYKTGYVIKVNKKTYTIQFDSGITTTRDKSFVQYDV